MNKYKLKVMLLATFLVLAGCNKQTEPAQPNLRKAVARGYQEDRDAMRTAPHNFLNKLRDKRFKELDTQLEDIQQRFNNGENEWVELNTIKQFMSDKDADSPYFNAWVRYKNGYWTALLARGAHYVAVGWTKRGTEYANATPASKMKQLRHYFALARQDINSALNQNPKALAGYYLLLQIARGTGTQADGQRAITAALKVLPDTYAIREEYMTMLEPKWGGSLSQMRAFARESQKWRTKNPTLYALLGFEYAYQGDMHREWQHYASAVKSYNTALKFAPSYGWYRRRADCLIHLKRYDEAVRDLNAVLQIAPNNLESLVKRADIYIERGQYPSAIMDYRRVQKLKPEYVSADNKLGWLYAQQNEFKLSAQYFDNTLKQQPDDIYALTRCGVVYLQLKNYDKATQCLNHALKLEPENAFAWRAYGDVMYVKHDSKYRDAYANYLKYTNPDQDKQTYANVKNILNGERK